MSEPFAIEFAEGRGATVYLRSALSAGDLLQLHETVDRLLSSATVLRIQVTSEAGAGMPGGLSEFVRYWRETRHRPVHLILVPPRTDRPARRCVPGNCLPPHSAIAGKQ